jgi:hypothetical protein
MVYVFVLMGLGVAASAVSLLKHRHDKREETIQHLLKG